jgi:hypothetical protein
MERSNGQKVSCRSTYSAQGNPSVVKHRADVAVHRLSRDPRRASKLAAGEGPLLQKQPSGNLFDPGLSHKPNVNTGRLIRQHTSGIHQPPAAMPPATWPHKQLINLIF